MALVSKKSRAKGLKKSEQLLGGGTVANQYAIGVIGPDPRRTSVLIVLIFAAAIALSLVFLGFIIIPGVLLIAVAFGAIDRPASVAVTNRGVAVLARSELNGRPRKLLAVLPQGVLADRTVLRSGGYVHLPEFHLWFRNNEYERLLAPAENDAPLAAWAPPVVAGIGAGIAGTPAPGGWAPPPSPPPPPAVAPLPLRSSVPVAPVLQPAQADGVIYCSWCGKERAVDANAIHYCGSMERPALYCMGCGASLEDGAARCPSCGADRTKLSR